MSSKTKAMLLLMLATFIWGMAYPINRYALGQMNPWSFSGIRYMFGSLALLPLVLRWGRRQAPADYFYNVSPFMWLWAGLCAGSLLAIGSGLQYYGLTDTTSAKSGFITGLYVTMVPLFGFILGQLPRKLLWVGLGVGFIGLYFLSNPGAAGAGGFTRGDALTLLADIFWATHVLVMGYFTVRVNAWKFVTSQAAVCSILCFIMARFCGLSFSWTEFVSIWPCLIYGILSVGLSYVCQAVAQKNTSPTAAALMMQFQSVIAAIAGVVFLNEVVTKSMILGASLLVIGTMIAQFSGEPKIVGPDHPGFRTIRIARVAMFFFILAVCAGSILFTSPIGTSGS